MAMFDGFDKVSVGLVSIGVGSRSMGGIVDRSSLEVSTIVGGHPVREHVALFIAVMGIYFIVLPAGDLISTVVLFPISLLP